MHPIIAREQSSLRNRVLSLLREGYLYPSRSNIIFVCGGNDPDHMRPKFIKYCDATEVNYLVFQPEYAIDHVYSLSDEPFNLSVFENLIGQLSLAIIIFPEGPGSFAEAGYFSAFPDLATKSILILDQDRLSRDSFLSIGPGKLIADSTRFHPQIQMMYSNPEFSLILSRIQERQGASRRKRFPSTTFNKTSVFDKLAIFYCIYNILEIATVEDVFFICKGLFSGRGDIQQIQQISSILIGAGLLIPFGESSEFKARPISQINCSTRDGFNEERNYIKLEILNLLEDAGKFNTGEFVDVA